MRLSTAEGGCPDEIKVFTFTVMGVKIGVDADQVAAVLEVDAAEGRGLPTRRFDEMIPFGGPVEYQAPKALLVRGAEGPYLVVIDCPDDLVLVEVGSIQPLPAVIVGTGSPSPLWGAVVGTEGILLLVDFLRS